MKIFRNLLIIVGLIFLVKFIIKKLIQNKFCAPNASFGNKIGKFIWKGISKKLDLDDEQRTNIGAIFSSMKEKCKENECSCTNVINLLMDQFKSDSFSNEELEKAINDKKDKCQSMIPFIIEKLKEIHGVLSHWQREIVVEKVEKIQGRCSCS